MIMLKISINAQERVIYGNGGYNLELAGYSPKVVYSLNELPENIKNKAIKQFKERLGADFYSKLTFVSATIVNLEGICKVEPECELIKSVLPTYEVYYKFSMLEKGLQLYFTCIKLRDNGDIFEPIDLPQISKFPEKANIISLKDAIKIARTNGLAKKNISVKIDYFSDHDSLIWVVSAPFRKTGERSITRIFQINAHTGSIIRDFMDDGTRFYE